MCVCVCVRVCVCVCVRVQYKYISKNKKGCARVSPSVFIYPLGFYINLCVKNPNTLIRLHTLRWYTIPRVHKHYTLWVPCFF